MYTAAYLIMDEFEVLLPAGSFLYKLTTTFGCRESDVEHFGSYGSFVHLLELN